VVELTILGVCIRLVLGGEEERSSMMNRTSALIGVLVLLVGTALASAEEGDELTVCMRRNPVDEEARHPRRFEYEILSSFAKATGLELVIKTDAPSFFNRPASTLPEVFVEGECEVYAFTITATPERAAFVEFTDTYFPVRVVLVKLQGQGYASPEELEGKKILLPQGSYYEAVLKKRAPGAEPVYIEGFNAEEWLAKLKEGQAHAVMCDSWMAVRSIMEHPELMPTLSLTETEYLAFALPKGSPLKARLDSHIQEMKQNGEFYTKLADIFGPEVAGMVAEELGARQPSSQ
jgi:ABC-type amino acid transport substrate-binding protein